MKVLVDTIKTTKEDFADLIESALRRAGYDVKVNNHTSYNSKGNPVRGTELFTLKVYWEQASHEFAKA